MTHQPFFITWFTLCWLSLITALADAQSITSAVARRQTAYASFIVYAVSAILLLLTFQRVEAANISGVIEVNNLCYQEGSTKITGSRSASFDCTVDDGWSGNIDPTLSIRTSSSLGSFSSPTVEVDLTIDFNSTGVGTWNNKCSLSLTGSGSVEYFGWIPTIRETFKSSTGELLCQPATLSFSNVTSTISNQHMVCALNRCSENKPPVASFSMDVASGTAPLTINVDASASSDPDGTIQSYQWTSQYYNNGQFDGQTPTGKITTLTFSSAGTYVITLTVTDNKGGTAMESQMVTVYHVVPHLVNISTRAYTSTGLSSVIAGFIIQGTGACNVMIRGFGKGIGLSPLLDSQLLLQTFPDGRVLATNQSWATGNDINQIPPGLHLPDSSDAGILTKLSAGAYTATMTPESVVGVGLIGVDQVSCDANTQLVNISTRAEVRDNLEVVIAGFIIDGSGTVKIMLRGFGAGIGISPCLDTHLRLDKFPSAELITENDNWGTAANATQIPAALQLPNNTDAGILVDLPAGAYTATMTRTASSCTGVGLIGVDVVQ